MAVRTTSPEQDYTRLYNALHQNQDKLNGLQPTDLSFAIRCLNEGRVDPNRLDDLAQLMSRIGQPPAEFEAVDEAGKRELLGKLHHLEQAGGTPSTLATSLKQMVEGLKNQCEGAEEKACAEQFLTPLLKGAEGAHVTEVKPGQYKLILPAERNGKGHYTANIEGNLVPIAFDFTLGKELTVTARKDKAGHTHFDFSDGGIKATARIEQGGQTSGLIQRIFGGGSLDLSISEVSPRHDEWQKVGIKLSSWMANAFLQGVLGGVASEGLPGIKRDELIQLFAGIEWAPKPY